MKSLSLLDLAFFLVESEGSPKHVAGVMLCKKPKNASRNFAQQLVRELKAHTNLTAPFNQVIQFIGWKGPHWKPVEDFSIDDHVFYHRPEKLITWQDVQNIVAKLHEPAMDRKKPLWEFHVIDRVKGGKFAVYLKIHHGYADGLSMTSWLNRSLSESPDDMQLNPIWSLPEPERNRPVERSKFLGETIRGVGRQSWEQLLVTGGMAKLSFQQLIERIGLTESTVSVPFNVTDDTPLTGSASAGRCIATAGLSMERIKRVGRATRSTVNHVAMACIDGALHRYLADSGITLDHAISIQMPVSLRKAGDQNKGNKVGILLVDMAEPTDDPYVRLRDIGFNLRNVKKQVEALPGASIERYSIISGVFGEVIEKIKLSDKLPVNGHTLVSNVPGSRNALYLKGAQVEQMYPISTLTPGLHMNITLFSYDGLLQFGLVATRDMKNLHVLAQYIEDELQGLEKAAGIYPCPPALYHASVDQN
jgi:diacylglycerol O-acyltransferase